MSELKFKKLLYKKTNGEYTLSGRYTNANTLTEIQHICGYKYEVVPKIFLKNIKKQSCPKCKYKRTKNIFIEEIAEYIRSLASTLEVQTNVTNILNNDKIDIYIPKNKFAIEFVSLYENSEIFKERRYHFDKQEVCNKKGIRMILIYEDSWVYKRRLVEEKIKYLLNRNRGKHRINLNKDKYVIKEISPQMKNKFLDLYHIQGKDTCKISLGLFVKSPITGKATLMSVMTFVKPRFDHKLDENPIDYELSRFASTSNYIISGSFSRMLDYFIKNYEVKNAISTYADKDWSLGEVYEKNGWIKAWDAPIAYYYADLEEGVRRNRQKFQKHKLEKQEFTKDHFRPEWSEKQILLQTFRFFRIYDCGNIKYMYYVEKELETSSKGGEKDA